MTERKYIFVPGINTRCEVIDRWIDLAEDFIDSATPYKATRYEYQVDALGRWMEQARHVANVAGLIRRIVAVRKVIVAHSNGCDIVCRALKENQSISVNEIHLIAAATHPRFGRNGLNLAVERGQVERIYLYTSLADDVLRIGSWLTAPLRWISGGRLGYGDLGRVGPKSMSLEAKARTEERRDDRMSHGGWFAGEQFEQTIRKVIGT